MKNTESTGDHLTFLGTGGARFMIISQTLASGGIWMNLAGTEILLDPGPGSIVQATKQNFHPVKLSAVIVSHRHLDHSGDVNVMVEAMTNSGLNPHGMVFAPADALGPEPILYSYLKKYLRGVVVLSEQKSYTLGDITFTTPVKHMHPVETYGMVFKTPKHTFSYIADTLFFKEISHYYGGEMLIINTLFLEHRFTSHDSPIEHLSVSDAIQIISELKPKTAILTHFGLSVLKANPTAVAERVSQKTGVRVIAATDGMRFDFSEMVD